MVTAPVLLGIDVGGTSTEAVVVAGGVDVIGRSTLPTGHGSRETILATVLEAGRLAVADALVDEVAAVGIGVPGIVDDATGSTRHAVNLGIEDDALDIGPALSDRLGVPSHVENDARAAAHGAYTLALTSDPQLRSLAYVSVGTGISAGFVLDGGPLPRLGGHRRRDRARGGRPGRAPMRLRARRMPRGDRLRGFRLPLGR